MRRALLGSRRASIVARMMCLAVAAIMLIGCQSEKAEKELAQREQALAALQEEHAKIAGELAKAEEALDKFNTVKPSLPPETSEKIGSDLQAQVNAARAVATALQSQVAQAVAAVATGKENLERAKESDDAFWGLGEVGAGIIAGFFGGWSAAAPAVVGVIRKTRNKSAEEAAEIVATSVNELRRQSPELDKAFESLSEKEKAVSEKILASIPIVARAVKATKKKAA